MVISAIVAGLFLTGCGKGGCSTTSLTQSGGSGSGSVSTGGTVCGSGTSGGGGTSAAHLFYIDFTTSLVDTLNYNTTGTLAAATGITAPTAAGVVTDDMTVVNKQFVYIPFNDINAVQAFSINDSTGGLTPITGSPFVLPGGTADSIIADPKGKFLFVGSEGIGSISVFQINSDGSLTLAPGSPFTSFNLLSADSLAVDGNGKFLYVGQLDPTIPVDVFAIDSNSGALSELGPFSLGVAQLHADSSGKYLLGVAEIADNPGGPYATSQISVFSIDPNTGAPTPVANSPFPTAAPTFDFVISPNAQFVYALENSGGTPQPLEGFQLNASTGGLTSLGAPYSSLPSPNYCKFDQSGGLLFCDTSGFSAITANPSTGSLSNPVQNSGGVSYFTFAWAVSD
jgi:6-phosphogluconolactonase (cycloisomerase 2 family)